MRGRFGHHSRNPRPLANVKPPRASPRRLVQKLILTLIRPYSIVQKLY